ncbi:DUF4468 domain-containing protein [Hymenobacter sp. H14-R3]|uniref:DUF4468 domain-containing protein n=1 Tax=Hymenobacter sp. H14-R3 TaxID=3046308 RepID=UPI0024B92593|nr:DUF4468 domain-containing protein [Hymenobacter sp. H14-R3]MDJ0367282.1 DUF4468 domain-containing protein [Hymenobacter sp. H14-R3]
MSKLLLLLTTLFCSFSALAQKSADVAVTDFPIKEDKLYYEGVVDAAPTAKQLDLYRTGRTWFVDTYVDAKEVLQLDDKADGKMMGKGRYKYSFVNGINISQVLMRFTLALDVKDGKYRYRMYNFEGDNVNTSMLGGANATQLRILDYNQCYLDLKADKRTKYNLKVLQGMDAQVKGIVASLQKAMMNAATGKDDF